MTSQTSCVEQDGGDAPVSERVPELVSLPEIVLLPALSSEIHAELARARMAISATNLEILSPAPAAASVPAPARTATVSVGAIGGKVERDYDPRLEWLLLCGDSTMGERGSTGAVVSQIERGSVGGSGNLDRAGSYKHPYTDLQLGAGHGDAMGDVELHRHLSAAWCMVRAATRRRLILRYAAPHAEYRADQGYGAKDRYVEGSDARSGQHAPTRTGLDPNAEFARYAALAFELTDKPAALLIAYTDPDPNHMKKGVIVINRKLQAQRAKVRAEALKVARRASAADHVEWFAAVARVPALRTFEQRTGRKRSTVQQERQQPRQGAPSGRNMRAWDSAAELVAKHASEELAQARAAE